MPKQRDLGGYKRSRFCGQDQFISGPVKSERPVQAVRYAWREVGLQKDTEGRWEEPGQTLARSKEQPGFQMRSRRSWKQQLKLLDGWAVFSPVAGGPPNATIALVSPSQASRSCAEGSKRSPSKTFPFSQPFLSSQNRAKEPHAHWTIYCLPTVTSPELLDFWDPPWFLLGGAPYPKDHPSGHGGSAWERGYIWNQLLSGRTGTWCQGQLSSCSDCMPSTQGKSHPHPHI